MLCLNLSASPLPNNISKHPSFSRRSLLSIYSSPTFVIFPFFLCHLTLLLPFTFLFPFCPILNFHFLSLTSKSSLISYLHFLAFLFSFFFFQKMFFSFFSSISIVQYSPSRYTTMCHAMQSKIQYIKKNCSQLCVAVSTFFFLHTLS